jgi:cell wall-associated NlpC family hydrolase
MTAYYIQLAFPRADRRIKLSSFLFMGFIVMLLIGCHGTRKTQVTYNNDHDIRSAVKIKEKVKEVEIDPGKTDADEFVEFAERLVGTKYAYGSADPKKGLDCSGFVYYVFGHFNIKVPRTSIAFTNAGKEKMIADARRGDLILFTGSDANSGKVGHMGIITENKNRKIKFIHSASGGNKGVTISGMSSYYIQRFVKVIRVFD